MSGERRRRPDDPARRGWCPSLTRPMPTGDGLLARVHPPLGVLSATQLRAVAEAARRYGNGHVDITARGNLQIRGVSEATAPALAASLGEAGLADVRSDGGPQRLTLTSALAGFDVDEAIDVLALARAIEGVGLTVPDLPAKTLVAIDGGGRWGLGAAEADVLVSATEARRVAIGLASETGTFWSHDLAVEDAPAALCQALNAFAATGRRRVRDLDAAERVELSRALPEPSRPGGMVLADAPEPGLVALPSRLAAIVAEAPFGRCTAESLDAVAALTSQHSLRLTPDRGLVLFVPHAEAEPTLAALACAGFITEPSDPRRAVAACPGAPACASGTTPVTSHAARLADAFAPFAARGLTAHVSGCAKGCAHPRKAGLTLVAEDGRYHVVVDGAPGDGGHAPRLTFEAALDRVRRADPARSLAGIFGP